MGLFDKKVCSICGTKIGITMIGEKKVSDGIICRPCVDKLSPFFGVSFNDGERRDKDVYKNSTVADIAAQQEYRARNAEEVANFQYTLTYGDDNVVYIDENSGRFMVGGLGRNVREDNPDIVSFSDVLGVNLHVSEHRDEIQVRDPEGHLVSTNPPSYNFSYDFYVIVNVRSPYFNQMIIKLNRDSVRDQSARNVIEMAPPPDRMGGPMGGPHGRPMGAPQGRPAGGSMKQGAPRPGGSAKQGAPRPMGSPGPMGGPGMPPVQTSNAADVQNSFEYQNYQQMAYNIQQALMAGRENAAYAAEAANQVYTCSHCGASTNMAQGGVCEYCGGSLYN